jgi:5-oxoprolinase (ATP-hydrolysing)/N-methylhydantoinase A
MIRDCGTGELVRLASDEEIVEVCLSGGSGFGDPHERALPAVARDVVEGLVTPAAAERDYGVVIHDGQVDVPETTRRRRLGTAAE